MFVIFPTHALLSAFSVNSPLVLVTLDKVAFAVNCSIIFTVEDTQANCN